MYDELFPAERAASLSQSTQRPYTPPPGPGAFSGVGSALADIFPNTVLTTSNAWSGLLDAYGKAAAYRDAPSAAAIAGRPAPDMAQVQRETIDLMGQNQLGPQLRAQAKRYAPDPLAVGAAGQIIFGVGTSLAKAGLYSLTGPAAPALFGADVGTNRADELKDQGVDEDTANLSGLVSGVAGAVGLKLPAALGATRLQSAAIGAAVNPALNVAEIGGIRALLQRAEYDKIAAQYDPFDPVSLTVAAVVGAGFGAGFYRARSRPDGPALTPDEHAAALVMHEVHARGADTLTEPGNLPAANAASDDQVLARQQMDMGEPVSVAANIPVDLQRVQVAARSTVDRVNALAGTEPALNAAGRAQAAGAQIVSAVDQAPAQGVAPTPLQQPAQTGATFTEQLAAALPPEQAPIVERVVDAVSRLVGREAPAQPKPEAFKADTPEQASAFDLATRNPDALVPTGEMDADGQPIHARAGDLVQHVAEIEKQAKTEAAAFEAAVNCALRFPR